MKTFLKKLCLLCTVLVSQMTYAALADYKAITWNMQASAESNQVKWELGVRTLLKAADVVALQGVVAPPSSAKRTDREIEPILSSKIYEYTWDIGTTQAKPDYKYIYFVEFSSVTPSDTVAIVTSRKARDIVGIPNPVLYQKWPPVLGVSLYNETNLDEDYFFTLSSHGKDSLFAIMKVYDYFSAKGDTFSSWMIIGNFAMPPYPLMQQLVMTHKEELLASLYPLFPSMDTTYTKGLLNYGFAGQVDRPKGQFNGFRGIWFAPQIKGMLLSDSAPVIFSKG